MSLFDVTTVGDSNSFVKRLEKIEAERDGGKSPLTASISLVCCAADYLRTSKVNVNKTIIASGMVQDKTHLEKLVFMTCC